MKADDVVSDYYLAEKGKAYFDHRSVETMAFGRIFQTRYSRSFCRKELDLLDFGCSDGLSLHNLPAKRQIGVDGSPYALEECKRLCQEIGIPIELHESVDTVVEDSIDVTISNHTLEHLVNPVVVLRQMRRVLRPYGTLVLVTPFDDFRSSKNRCWQTRDKNHHLFTWSPLNLGNLVTEVGFEVKECRIHTSAWNPKFFWIHKLFGLIAFKTACFLSSILQNRLEVFRIVVNTKD